MTIIKKCSSLIKRFSLGLVVFYASCYVISVNADTLSNLYTAKIAVQDQSATSQSQALQQGLVTVLTRLTGDNNVKSNATLATAMDNPKGYLQESSYLVDNQGQPYFLFVFQETAMNNLVKNAQEPLWTGKRPQILAWVAINDKTEKTLLSNDSTDDYSQGLEKAAAQWQLPVELPLMDLEDLNAISYDNVWQGQMDAIQKASARYNIPVILLGNITETTDANNPFQGKWTLITGNNTVTWNNNSSSAEESTSSAVTWVMASLAKSYASTDKSVAISNQPFLLAVYGVKGVNNYNKVNQYLANLSGVKNVDVENLSPDHVVFSINTSVDTATLSSTIAMDNILKPLSLSSSDKEKDIQLTYELLS